MQNLVLSEFQKSLFALAGEKSWLEVKGPVGTGSSGLGKRQHLFQGGTKIRLLTGHVLKSNDSGYRGSQGCRL